MNISNYIYKQTMIFISGNLSGILIAIGATALLNEINGGHKELGTFLFGLGLFTIIKFKLYIKYLHFRD